MNNTDKKDDDSGTVLLEGELTLPRAAELKGLFEQALADAASVSVRFGDVRDLDLSCLQLLCAAHRTAVRMKKKMALEGERPRLLMETAKNAGFVRETGCKYDAEESCFWAVETGAGNGRGA
jgi:anti-anti-sigma regulatory factor